MRLTSYFYHRARSLLNETLYNILRSYIFFLVKLDILGGVKRRLQIGYIRCITDEESVRVL